MIGGVFGSKIKLALINEIITIKKMIHSGINYFFKNFTVNRQKRNRPIIFTEKWVIFLKSRCNFGKFGKARENSCFK